MNLMKRWKQRICLVLALLIIPIALPETNIYAISDTTSEIAERVLPTKFNTLESRFEENAGMLLIDMTSGKPLEGFSVSSAFYSNEAYKLAFILAVLENADLDKQILIGEEIEQIDKSKYIIGLKKDDVITVSSLLQCYMYTEAEDARVALLTVLGFTELELRTTMDLISKKGIVVHTKFAATMNDPKGTNTCAYDLYFYMDELVKYNWFMENIGKNKLEISFFEQNGEKKIVSVIDSKYDDVTSIMPRGYKLIGHFTNANGSQSTEASNTGSQIIFMVATVS